jgi:Na+/H+-dicarboxylate symporter
MMMRKDSRGGSSLPCLSAIAQTVGIAVLLHIGGVQSQRVASTVVLTAVLTVVLTVVLAVILTIVLAVFLAVGLGMDTTSCKQHRQDRSETHGDDWLKARGGVKVMSKREYIRLAVD